MLSIERYRLYSLSNYFGIVSKYVKRFQVVYKRNGADMYSLIAIFMNTSSKFVEYLL